MQRQWEYPATCSGSAPMPNARFPMPNTLFPQLCLHPPLPGTSASPFPTQHSRKRTEEKHFFLKLLKLGSFPSTCYLTQSRLTKSGIGVISSEPKAAGHTQILWKSIFYPGGCLYSPSRSSQEAPYRRGQLLVSLMCDLVSLSITLPKSFKKLQIQNRRPQEGLFFPSDTSGTGHCSHHRQNSDRDPQASEI